MIRQNDVARCLCACPVGVMVGLLAIASPAWSQAPAARGSQPSPSVAIPTEIEIVRENGQRSRFAIADIKKASTGSIPRNGDDFPFTPLTVVMKAAGIPNNARLRVTAAAGKNEMTLQRGAAAPVFNPDHFGFIFNQQGLAVLTPKPGTPPAAAQAVNERPQVRGVVKIEVIAR